MSVAEKVSAAPGQKALGKRPLASAITLASGIASGPAIEGRRSAFVVNRTGGQGKTLITQLLAAFLADQGRTIICVDKASGPDNRSKLGRSVHGVVEMGSGPELATALNDQLGFVSHWDEFGGKLMESDTIVDVGANVIDSIVSWAKIADATVTMTGQVACDLVVPVVASPQSASDAVAIIRTFASGEVLPLRSVTIVQNLWQGDFKAMEANADFQTLGAFVNANPEMASIVVLPRAVGDWVRRAEEDSVSFATMAGWSVKDMSGQFDFNAFQATREMKFLRDFLTHARQAMALSGALSGAATVRDRGAPR